LTWSPEGRKRIGISEIKWERAVKSVMRHKNLTPEGSLKQNILRKATVTGVKLANCVVDI
jgi:hypothetical protein